MPVLRLLPFAAGLHRDASDALLFLLPLLLPSLPSLSVALVGAGAMLLLLVVKLAVKRSYRSNSGNKQQATAERKLDGSIGWPRDAHSFLPRTFTRVAGRTDSHPHPRLMEADRGNNA